MARKLFDLQPTDESFLDTAPDRFVGTFEIARPASEVWADLAGDNPLHWCRILSRITWTSARPLGVGATRTAVALGGALVLEERFPIWEEGRRMAFVVERASLPLFRRFGEDYVVEPTSETSCRFTWTLVAEVPPALALTRPGNTLLTKSLFRDTRKHYGAA